MNGEISILILRLWE